MQNYAHTLMRVQVPRLIEMKMIYIASHLVIHARVALSSLVNKPQSTVMCCRRRRRQTYSDIHKFTCCVLSAYIIFPSLCVPCMHKLHMRA